MILNKKLVVILGQTASGKTALSIKLALLLSSGKAKKRFGTNGVEIISADSRQVYKSLNIGSGKITQKEMQGIPHHLLDVASPKRKFTVAQFQKLALKKIKEIQKRNKIPFLVGGTGFYIQLIVDGLIIPEVKPDWKLRKKLAKKSVEELFLMLKKLNPKRAKNIDSKNPHRLIRAIEIALNIKPNQPLIPENKRLIWPEFDIIQIGIKKSPDELKKAIHIRLQKRIKGIISEVKKLNKSGLSFKRLEELGLEYRFVAQYIQGNLTYQEMINKLQKEIEHFAKRQMTWFKKDKRINWVKNYKEAEKLIIKFL